MNKKQFYADMCNYYHTNYEKEKVRIFYLDKVLISRKVDYSEQALTKIFNVCQFFPTVKELSQIFSKPVKTLEPIGGSNGK